MAELRLLGLRRETGVRGLMKRALCYLHYSEVPGRCLPPISGPILISDYRKGAL